MQVIPVIDLLGGQVVRGIAGRRQEYRPIVSQIAADARPATIAQALVERFGFETVYVADLDAILHGRLNVAACQAIAESGMKLWLDAGISNLQVARSVVRSLRPAVKEFLLIVGLESLQSLDERMAITKDWDFPVVSLDLRGGTPLSPITDWKDPSPLGIASELETCGIWDMIVLDLADVGQNAGTSTLELCRLLKQRLPRQRLIAGGGVRGLDDLKALSDAGCDAALVASALHDGRLTRQDVERAREFRR
jgi:phosphoribosylformimino-5-aminoimidazole carboxamide ribotide isomerase